MFRVVNALGELKVTYVGGGSVTAHQSSHNQGGTDALKLDDLAIPDNNTDLNVTTSYHGLTPRLSGSATQFLNGVGAWVVPATVASVYQIAEVFQVSNITYLTIVKI